MSKAAKVSFEIFNDGKEEAVCSVYCAAYSGGKLTGIERTQYTAPPHGSVAVSRSLEGFGGERSFKLFVWKDGSLMPIKVYDDLMRD